MANISADRKIAYAESEVTYGTNVISGTPSSWLALRAIDITPIVSPVESPRATFSASGEAHCMLRSHCDVSWEMPFTGRVGAAGTGGAWEPFLLASGFKAVVDSGVSVTYTPNTENTMALTPSASIKMYKLRLEDANAYMLFTRGYRGNATLTFNIGEEAVLGGEGMGLFEPYPLTTVAKPSAPTAYVGATCMIVQNLTITVGAIAYECESLELQTNWAMQEIRTGEATKGTLSKVLLTRPMSGGRFIGSFSLVDGGAAMQDMITKWQAGTAVALSITLSDGTRSIAISAPSIQFGQPSETAEGVVKFDVPFFLNRVSAGDDELSIALT